METINILILSFIQGVTEILPVSSTGHLILVGELLDIDTNIHLLSVLHIGTTLAILIFYRKEILQLIKIPDMILKIFIAIIPAGLFGFFLAKYIQPVFFTPLAISISLILWGVVMIFTENFYKGRNETDLKKLKVRDVIVIGIAQILAFIPGTSRSGITTLAGIYTGLEKYTALSFSFIIGIPVLLGGSLYETIQSDIKIGDIYIMIISVLTSFIFAYISISIVSKLKKKKWFTFFGIYRIILGLLILAILL